MIKKIIFILFIVNVSFVHSNSLELKDILFLIKYDQFEKLNSKIELHQNKDYYKHLKQFVDFKQSKFLYQPIKFESSSNSVESKIFSFLNKGLYDFHVLGIETSAFKNFNKALNLSTDLTSRELTCEILKNILTLYEYYSDITNEKTYTYFLNLYKKTVFDKYENVHYQYYEFRLPFRFQSINDYKVDKQKINLLQKEIERLDYPFLSGKFYISKATLFFHYIKNKDSAYIYLNKAKKKLSNNENIYYKERYLATELNEIHYYIKEEKFDQARKKISKLNIPKKNHLFKILLKFYYIRKWKIFEGINRMDSAMYFKAAYLSLEKQINHDKSLTEISKLKTLEKEKENLQLKQEKEQHRNLLLGSFIFILLGGIIVFLLLKNSKRKRKLAEQQKELETQKNLTLLKEQEITTINAMVEGQEKERKRVAEDLHDNLGSVLATLKLHFDNLKLNKGKKKLNQEKLFDKTEKLIDEAYLKVRKIAHAKNAGVIANKGLLTAVQMMAEKISSADKIHIEVIHYGLNKRLENNLEIGVFRIIQELTTNILKHAEAKNATIHISLYDKNLNIIVEDDGKGFDIEKVDIKNGMGIHSIKTRIEHLEGTFEIDSTIHKGTSIIMNIPISSF